MISVASSHTVLGRHAEALKLFEETWSLQKTHLGLDHPDTLRGMNGVAVSYANLGRHVDAVKLYEKTLELERAKLGSDHPDTFQTMYNLAISYAALGRQMDALQLREEALALHKAKLGPDHPRTLMSMNSVAWSYAALGRHADALKLHEETLALQKARLGPDHRDTLLTMWGVAHNLVKLGRDAEALPVIDECLGRVTSKIVAPQLLRCVIDLRMQHFEQAGDAAGCQQTAEMWENLKRTDADSLYKAACLRAVTAAAYRAADKSSTSIQQAEAEADRAMAWLRQAVAEGYQNGARLKEDKNLDALRERADFAKLITALQASPSGMGVRQPANMAK
jgi:tetratricopeptide (TPR) repeat protein